MDELNKVMKTDENLKYRYKNDSNIEIGVLGVVDDTIAIAECGNNSVKKNAVVNSFVETRRLMLHETKSVVVHIGKPSKCETTCPALKVHKSTMPVESVTKYLGNYVTSKGTNAATIEDRRNKGWGKVATIIGILGEVGMGVHRVQAGLLLRKAVLHTSLLYSAEAWSNISVKDVKRLEQVDTHLIKLILGGHSKCSNVFYHLETGTLMLRHILMIHRMMYHHHIITRNENETIKKVYNKQKEVFTKGDWFQMVLDDFKFVNKEMNEEEIKLIPKETYRKKMKEMVSKAAFDLYKEKLMIQSKTKDLKYKKLEIQDYLRSDLFSKEERELLVKLRSKCHYSKANFKTRYQNKLNCTFGCQETETQEHVFQTCKEIKQKFSLPYNDINQSVEKQKRIIEVFLKIDKERKTAMEALLPGGDQLPGPMLDTAAVTS